MILGLRCVEKQLLSPPRLQREALAPKFLSARTEMSVYLYPPHLGTLSLSYLSYLVTRKYKLGTWLKNEMSC